MTKNEQGPFGPVDEKTFEGLSVTQQNLLIYNAINGMCKNCGAARSKWQKVFNPLAVLLGSMGGGFIAHALGLGASNIQK